LPVATELLQPMAAGYFDDLLSWVAIGARTTESQIHREMASGLSMPVGFKNGTDGGAAIAVDAMRSAAHPHRHFGVDSQGHPAVIQTPGNPDTHLVLRGGHKGPNHDRDSVARIHADLNRLKIPAGSWSIAATPTAARTHCVSLPYSTKCLSNACKVIVL
jgi:3-deoxy-7-phosphoheptulonate synthase